MVNTIFSNQEWVVGEGTYTTEGDNTVFTFTVINANIEEAVEDIELIPYFGSFQRLIYISHTATRGTYDYVSNTWTIDSLAPEEVATLTVTTDAIENPEVPAPTSTEIADIFKSKLIGEKVITHKKVDGEIYAMAKSATSTTGGSVLLRNSNCGPVTTGLTHRPASNPNDHGGQIIAGLNQGQVECTYPPGDNGDEPSPDDPDANGYNSPIECPGANLPMPDGSVNCPTEPPVDEDCMVEYDPGQFHSPYSWSEGIQGGSGYHVNFGKGLWIYPGADKPTFYLDLSINKETENDPRGAKPDCWSKGGFEVLQTCEELEEFNGYKCPDACCFWPGETDLATLYDNVCDSEYPHPGPIWQNHAGEKFQFWYPFGAVWIFIKKAGVSGDGQGMIYPTGYTYRDGSVPWSIYGGPDFILGLDSEDYKEDYDPDHGGSGGHFGNRMDYATCMEKLKVQVPNDARRSVICKESTEGESQEGWTDCMKRLYAKMPDITAEQAATMCNNHPDWTTCMINLFYSTGGTMTEEELQEACRGQGDSHTIPFNVGLCSGGDCSPFLITDMVFWIAGTSTCVWGWPSVALWWSNPSSAVQRLRVCMPTEQELQDQTNITNHEI